MLQKHDFYLKYVNVPIERRNRSMGPFYPSLKEIYEQIKQNDETMDDKRAENELLVRLGEQTLNAVNRK